MKIALIGYGKMGREIERILVERGHSIALIVDRDNTDDLTPENLHGVDAAIEFTTPSTAFDNLRICFEAGVPVVCGTTGWTERLHEAEALCPVSTAEPFSTHRTTASGSTSSSR